MVKVTLALDDDVWPAFRIACIQRGTSASRALTEIMRQRLATWEQGGDDPERVQPLCVVPWLCFIGASLMFLAVIAGGCTAVSPSPRVTPETEAICAPLVPAVASALTSVEKGGSLDAHETAQMRQWDWYCQDTVWQKRLTTQLYGSHQPSAEATDSRTFGERLLDVLVDNHRGGATVQSTTCRTMRTTGRKGSAYVTNCSTY
jgi:hypothetical protein